MLKFEVKNRVSGDVRNAMPETMLKMKLAEDRKASEMRELTETCDALRKLWNDACKEQNEARLNTRRLEAALKAKDKLVMEIADLILKAESK